MAIKPIITTASIITTDSDESKKTILKNLLSLFAKLKKNEQELIEVMQKLEQHFKELDDIIAEQINEWHKHDNLFAEELINELLAQGISLTELEKEELKRGLKTISLVKKAIEEKGITIPRKSSRFKIKTMASIIAALGRSLLKIDNSSVNNILNKLKSIAVESINAQNLSQTEEALFADLKQKVKKLDQKLLKVTGLNEEEKYILNQAISIVSPEKTLPTTPSVIQTIKIEA